MAEPPRILLEHHLKKLKLPTFLREYEKLARQCAAEGLDHVQFLARLVEMELIDRERRLSLGSRCANPVTHSYTESDTPNTASGDTTARSKWVIFDCQKCAIFGCH